MNVVTPIPAVLLYYDRDGELVQAETNADPLDCDSVYIAAGNLAVRRPALVAVGDVPTALAQLAAWTAD